MEKKFFTGGIDEVGRGALAGPLVVACVAFKSYKQIPYGIKDSKSIASTTRFRLYNEIINQAFYGISVVRATTIDKLGIEKATENATLNSFKKLKNLLNLILLDGNIKINTNIQYKNIIKGDCNYVSVAAASIIAKCTRDKIMIELSKENINYGWHTNFGYGTKEHLLALEKYGITKYHRKCYAPIKFMVK